MGLTGTTSWSASANPSTVQRYKRDGSTANSITYQGENYFILASTGINMTYTDVIFTVTTDAAGCSELSFTCGGRRVGSSGPPKLYWKIQTEKNLNRSGMTEASKVSSGWAGNMTDLQLLPNTTYYIHFYGTYGSDSGHSCELYGTMTITGSGTYGEPGDIVAPDAVNFNEEIEMSYGSVTAGGRYTVSVQMGESNTVWAADTPFEEGDLVMYDDILYKCLEDHTSEEDETPDILPSLWKSMTVVLQTYDDYTGGTAVVASTSLSPAANIQVNADTFAVAVDNISGSYVFDFRTITDGETYYFGWFLNDQRIYFGDYGISQNPSITYRPDQYINIDFTASGENDSLTWTPQIAAYADDFPNQPTVPCTITVETYFGTTLSGTRTKTVTVSFTQAQVGPEIDNTVFTIAPKNEGVVTGFSGYIQNYSAIRAAYDSTGVTLKYSATVVDWTVRFGSRAIITPRLATITYESETITSATVDRDTFGTAVNHEYGTYEFGYDGTDWSLGSDTVDLDDYGIAIEGTPDANDTLEVTFGIASTEDGPIISATTTVTFTLTDSRGFTVSQTRTATITPYQMPTLNANVFRCDGTGTAADDGSYISVTLSAVYANIAGQNTLLAQEFSKLKTASAYGTAVEITGGTTTLTDTNKTYAVTGFLITGFQDRVYDIQVKITDAIGNIAVLSFVLESQAWAIHVRNGGNGIAFGKVSEADNQVQIPADWEYYKGINKAILSAYPVGSIYMSVNSTNPGTLFGGTWERITGRFLLAADDTGADQDNVLSRADIQAGHVGGEAAHQLTENELAAHTHTQDEHRHGMENIWSSGSGSKDAYMFTGSRKQQTRYTDYQTPTINSTGGDEPHNNMPPFLAVYIWKRTA